MAKSTLLQVRTAAEDKARASEILEELGTNLSSVVNMLLKQIILTGGIPFEIKKRQNGYSSNQIVNEVAASMSLEDMPLSPEELSILMDIEDGKYTTDEARKKILAEAKQDG